MRQTSVTMLTRSPQYSTTITVPSGASGILVQLDQASDREILDATQNWNFRGVDLFKLQTRGWWPNAPLHRGDTLRDDLVTNTETGALFVYRVVSRPKDHSMSHQECLVEVVVGD